MRIIRTSIAILAAAAVVCLDVASAQAPEPPSLALDSSRPIDDLRAPQWRSTTVLNTGGGVVQHTGDEIFATGTIDFLRQRLTLLLPVDRTVTVQLKTSDIRIYLPDVKVDVGAVAALQSAVPKGAMLAAPIALLMSSFSKNKSASAVFCLSINDRDYLGNDARLFRYGAEAELKASIDAAASALAKNIASDAISTSPACEPGWEGGQPSRQ